MPIITPDSPTSTLHRPERPSGEGTPGFTVGLIGTIVSALCCFTPLLVIALGAVGLYAALGWLDYVVLPVLAWFVVMTIYALFSNREKS